jgi:hypothetical protein
MCLDPPACPRTAAWPGRRSALAALVALASCAQPPQQAEKTRELVWPPAPEPPRFYFERTVRSSGDVVADGASDLRRMVTGESGAGEPLSKPYAVAVTAAASSSPTPCRASCACSTCRPASYSRIGDDEGAGQLVKPIGLDVDGAGNLYVADIGAEGGHGLRQPDGASCARSAATSGSRGCPA